VVSEKEMFKATCSDAIKNAKSHLNYIKTDQFTAVNVLLRSDRNAKTKLLS
jgi:hypothetical protein